MSLVLRMLAPRIMGPAAIVAIALVIKGYSDAGDGFSAGVILALAVGLRYVTLGAARTERTLPLARQAPQIAVAGLLIALAVGFHPVALGEPPFTHAPAPGEDVTTFGALELSTAVAFDVGLFLLVSGGLVTMLHHLARLVEGRRR